MRTRLSFSTAVLAACALLAAGCGEGAGDDAAGPTVVATTTQVGDVAANIAGDRAEVVTVLSPNADPHEYEPQPSDAEALAGADLIVRSGGDVDLWIDDLIESSGSDAPQLSLLDEAPHTRPDDPHWWQDPRNAVAAAQAIGVELTDIDPEGESEYARNARSYSAELDALDRAIARCMASIPSEDRELVTSHDSLGLFADRYGLEVIGSTIPALTTQAQPSAGEIAELVDLIEAEDVAAVFPEAGVSGELEQTVADETGASVGEELHADALAPDDSPASTYAGAMRSNAATIATALGGDAGLCEAG